MVDGSRSGESELMRKLREKAEKREQQFAEEEKARQLWQEKQAHEIALRDQEEEKYGRVLPPGSRVVTNIIPTASGHSEASTTTTRSKSTHTRVVYGNPLDENTDKKKKKNRREKPQESAFAPSQTKCDCRGCIIL